MNKKCTKCTNDAIWTDYTGKNLCKPHFLDQIERRIRKNLRVNKLINVKKEYYIEENEENKHTITKHFLKKIFENRLKLTKNKNAQKITSNTLNDEAQELLNQFMKDNKENENNIKPLSVITDEEAKTIAKILNVSLNIKPKKHEELTKKDPQLLFSMHKSKEFLEKRQ